MTQEAYFYTAFGTHYVPKVLETVPQRYTFAGREAAGPAAAAAGGPMYYRYRMYSPGLGRFGRRDPLLSGDPLFNAYGFPGANALRRLDPWGLELTGAARLEAEAQLSWYITMRKVPSFYRPIDPADVDTASANKKSTETLLRANVWRGDIVVGHRWYLACDEDLIAEKQRRQAEGERLIQEEEKNQAIAAARRAAAKKAEAAALIRRMQTRQASAVSLSVIWGAVMLWQATGYAIPAVPEAPIPQYEPDDPSKKRQEEKPQPGQPEKPGPAPENPKPEAPEPSSRPERTTGEKIKDIESHPEKWEKTGEKPDPDQPKGGESTRERWRNRETGEELDKHILERGGQTPKGHPHYTEPKS